MNEETAIQNDILAALSREGYLCRRNIVGSFRPLYGRGVIQIGTTGEPDIGVIVPVTLGPEHVGRRVGVAVGVEVKTLTGRQRDGQKLYQLAMERHGAPYILARSTESALRDIRNFIDRGFTA